MNKKQKPVWVDILKRFMKNKLAVISLVILAGITICAIFAPYIAPFDPNNGDLAKILAKPGGEHLLGCDENGRDILSRIIYGARISLSVGFIAIAISSVFGILIGLASAYYGKKVDAILMRILDMVMAFPGVLLAIIFMSVFGKGIENAIIAISIVSIPGVARIVRASALSVKENDYIQSAKAIGCNDRMIMFRHILPNIMAPIIVNATMSISGAILQTAALGFLGLGVQPPTAEWGYMLANGKSYIFSAPHIITFPGIAIAITVLCFNLFGDGLRDALDPRLK